MELETHSFEERSAELGLRSLGRGRCSAGAGVSEGVHTPRLVLLMWEIGKLGSCTAVTTCSDCWMEAAKKFPESTWAGQAPSPPLQPASLLLAPPTRGTHQPARERDINTVDPGQLQHHKALTGRLELRGNNRHDTASTLNATTQFSKS